MKILITGATGFVGGAIANKLKERNEVAGLARSESSAGKLREMGIGVVCSDLLEVTSEHLADYEVVIHCAAFVEEWGSKRDFFDTNVVGTERLLIAAKAAKVNRFIFIGTEAAFFTGDDLNNIDESIPYPKNSPYLYSRSKAQAEQRVLSAASSDFIAVSLRPRFVWGPGDQSVMPALIEMIQQRRFTWINKGRFLISSTYIDNLVHAAEQALKYGEAGEAYFIADDGTIELREFLTRALAALGVEVPSNSMPKYLARFTAQIFELIWKMLGIQLRPPLVRFSVDMMSANCTVNTEKAKKILNYDPPISRDEGLVRLKEF